MAKKFPVTERTDVLPAELPGFKAKYGQTKHSKAMNEPNTPRPAKSAEEEVTGDAQGWIDREEHPFNITGCYWGQEDKNPFSGDDD